MASFVDTWGLTGRADEQAREEVGEGGVPLPVEHKALQKVRPAQEGAVIRICTADDHMITTAGAGVAAIDHELVRTQTAQAGFFVDGGGNLHAFLPVGSRMDVDLDDARIWRNADDIQPLIMRWRIALDMNRQIERPRSTFRRGDEIEIFLQRGGRWHEDADPSIAHFHGDGSAHAPADFLVGLAELGLLRNIGPQRMLRHDATLLRREVRKRRTLDAWIDRIDVGIPGGRNIGQRVQRQAEADRAVARNEIKPPAACAPFFADPAAA